MKENKYRSNQDYCDSAKNSQSVPSFEQYHQKYPDIPEDKVNDKRSETLYSCPDNYQMGSIQDNQIYIATTDGQHDQIKRGEHVDADRGLSGYFSDQATVDACKNGEALDNTKYNEMCQIAPYREGGINGVGDATYKPHVDCFDIDRDALYKNYGTYDFNAAIGKCEANNQFGGGGGNQGYNPYISEMIDKGVLKYNPENSYSDSSISRSEHNNPNSLTNSTVDEVKADKMYSDAQTRAQDCVKNDTPHPSPEACQNGFPKNEHPIESNTGNATPKKSSSQSETETTKRGKKEQEPVQNNGEEAANTKKYGHKPDPTENNEQHKEPIIRGKREQEPVQNNGNEAANTQKRGFTPSNENNDAIKTVDPATEQSSKVAEEASKQAAEQAGRKTAKTAALGV